MPELTPLETQLLRLVRKGQGQWGWYQLATRLSRVDVPREPDMMAVLKNLAGRGLLIREVEAGSPNDRWALTPEGESLLAREDQEGKQTERTAT